MFVLISSEFDIEYNAESVDQLIKLLSDKYTSSTMKQVTSFDDIITDRTLINGTYIFVYNNDIRIMNVTINTGYLYFCNTCTLLNTYHIASIPIPEQTVPILVQELELDLEHDESIIDFYNSIEDRDTMFEYLPMLKVFYSKFTTEITSDEKLTLALNLNDYDKEKVIKTIEYQLDVCNRLCKTKRLRLLIIINIINTLCKNYKFVLDHENLKKIVVNKFVNEIIEYKEIINKILNKYFNIKNEHAYEDFCASIKI